MKSIPPVVALASLGAAAVLLWPQKEKYIADDGVGVQVNDYKAIDAGVHDSMSRVMDSANWFGCMPVLMVIDYLKLEIAKQSMQQVNCTVIKTKLSDFKQMYTRKISEAAVSPKIKSKMTTLLTKTIDAVNVVVDPLCSAGTTTGYNQYIRPQVLLDALRKIQMSYCPPQIGPGVSPTEPHTVHDLRVVATVDSVTPVAPSTTGPKQTNPPGEIVFKFKADGKDQQVTFKGVWQAPVVQMPTPVTVQKGAQFLLLVSPMAPYTIKTILPLESQIKATVSTVTPTSSTSKTWTVVYVHGEGTSRRSYKDTLVVHTAEEGGQGSKVDVFVNNQSSRINAILLTDIAVAVNTANPTIPNLYSIKFQKYGSASYTGKLSGGLYRVDVEPKSMKIRKVLL